MQEYGQSLFPIQEQPFVRVGNEEVVGGAGAGMRVGLTVPGEKFGLYSNHWRVLSKGVT